MIAIEAQNIRRQSCYIFACTTPYFNKYVGAEHEVSKVGYFNGSVWADLIEIL